MELRSVTTRGPALAARRRSVWLPGATARATVQATLLWAALASAPVLAGKAHEHGVARADVGVEAGVITVSLDLPLEVLVGFERAPRTDAERTAVAAALGKLQESTRIVRIDTGGGCGTAKVNLVAPLWGVGAAAPAATASAATATATATAKAGGEHGDLQASYEFRCSNTDRAAQLDLGLFDAFARLKRIEVQAVTRQGQMKLVLRRPNGRVTLPR
ncbi:MAG: DUF2796 domain-containing protein [Rubrivivax sp.]|nr:DUF2796 domain-containing protein [Rubrivivax sp.]